MVREVLIVRPSACEPPKRWSGKPRQVAQRIGAYLMAAQRLPDGIVATPDHRSRQLAEGAAKVMGLSAASVAHAPRLRRHSGASLVGALQVLQGDRLLAVGAGPGLALPSGPLLTIERLDATEPRVSDVVSHADLPATFPFPTLSGVEQRPYPAYYYFQSGAIPYRVTGAGAEILLIRNSKRTKWGIPKGIHEPGYSAPASAAKEAFEEAGVLGDVEDEVLGTYTVRKWGGTCSVTVFPMHVTCTLPDDEWIESHRGRSWLPADRAAAAIKNAGLSAIVAAFAETLAAR